MKMKLMNHTYVRWSVHVCRLDKYVAMSCLEVLLTYLFIYLRCDQRLRCHALIDLSTNMAQRDSSSQFSAPKQGIIAAETTGQGGYRSGGNYTVTLDTNPSVEHVQTYVTKPLSPTSYVPSSSEFDFMSSSLGSPSGTLENIIDDNSAVNV